MDKINILPKRMSMVPLDAALMGASLQYPLGEVIGIYPADEDVYEAHGCSAMLLLKSDNREFAVPLDVMLQCLKSACDHTLLPSAPRDWAMGIASDFAVESQGSAHCGGRPVHQCRAEQSYDSPVRDMSYHGFKDAGLSSLPHRLSRRDSLEVEYYAVCPSCLNPLRIFNFLPRSGEAYAPYGLHVYQETDLFWLDQVSLATCPLHAPHTIRKELE